MKTSIDIDDALLERARRRARRDQVTIKQLIENGLRLALQEPRPDPGRQRFEWPMATATMTRPLNEMTVNEQIDAMREGPLNQWLPQLANHAQTSKRRTGR
jgi:hypothetical protein